jgi:hypothetical protein
MVTLLLGTKCHCLNILFVPYSLASSKFAVEGLSESMSYELTMTRYESYIGRWSKLVARQFLAWLDVPSGLQWLDVGCGTGKSDQWSNI